jgi:hypothetical protein
MMSTPRSPVARKISSCGNHDVVLLGGSGARATVGTGTNDRVVVGDSTLGTNETLGSALGDKVTFGAPHTAVLVIDPDAEAGSTAGTTSIGLTKVLNAAAGMEIAFIGATSSSNIVDETTAVKSSTSLTMAENTAVATLAGAGVAYFAFHGNEYFISTHGGEMAVSSHDAIVELVGITNIHHAANNFGEVTLHM